MGLIKRLTQVSLASIAGSSAGWAIYTRNTRFIPLDTTSPSYPTSAASKLNPSNNPPACVDHAIRIVPLSKLKTTDQETLTKDFCRGVWGGWGFWYQRRFLERKWRSLEGREGMLWSREEMEGSAYEQGTMISDHFEVVERSPEKVVVRCGDSPLIKDRRPSDGIFAIEVTKDAENATFHLKSSFFNSTPEGANGGPLPWHFQFLHREYTKLWMETSVRRLLK